MATKTFNTLHIFGFGKVQIIGDDENKKGFNKTVDAGDCKKLQAVINEVFGEKPQDNTSVADDYRAINVFNGMFVDFQANGAKGFRVQWKDLTAKVFEDLVTEVQKLP